MHRCMHACSIHLLQINGKHKKGEGNLEECVDEEALATVMLLLQGRNQ